MRDFVLDIEDSWMNDQSRLGREVFLLVFRRSSRRQFRKVSFEYLVRERGIKKKLSDLKEMFQHYVIIFIFELLQVTWPFL